MHATTVEELETRLAYQDDALNQLSDTVYAQARQIEQLAERCRELESRIQALTEDTGPGNDDSPPPHY